jgi:Kef-type K+ transport system membrane component KefB
LTVDASSYICETTAEVGSSITQASTSNNNNNGYIIYIAISVSIFAVLLIMLGGYCLWKKSKSRALVQ